MAGLCIFTEITESFGASSCSVDAQPASKPSHALSSVAASAARRASGMPMRQHVRRDQHHALLGDEEFLRVLIAIEADARTRSEYAMLVDDGVANLAVRPDAHIGQDHGAFHHRTLLDAYAREQQRLAHRGAGNDGAPRHQRVDGDTAPAVFIEYEFRRRRLRLVGPDGPVFVVDI